MKSPAILGQNLTIQSEVFEWYFKRQVLATTSMQTKIENESLLTLLSLSQLFEIDKLYGGTSGIIKSVSIL